MKTETLKELGLTDEQIKGVMAENGKSLQGAKDNEAKLADFEAENKSLTETVASYKSQLNELKESSKDNEALQKQITDLQDANTKAEEGYKTQLADTQKANAIELALRDNGARNSKAVKALLDNDSIIFKEGKLVGLDDQIKTIKADNEYLFQGEAKPATPQITTEGNANPATNGDKDPFASKLAKYAD